MIAQGVKNPFVESMSFKCSDCGATVEDLTEDNIVYVSLVAR